MGSLSGASSQKVWAVLPFAITMAVLVPRLTRALNGFVLGESEAFHLGIDVETAKRLAVGVTAAAVAVAGLVGFVGLVVPHLVRLIAGADHRIVLPASAFVGATLVVVADVAARMVVQPAELPLGIIMALIGAPIFLHLVLNRGAGAET
jgi:iron complex transport system permease protein